MSGSRVRSAFSGRTAWARSLQAPLRDFLATETGSAVVLLGGGGRGAGLGQHRPLLLRERLAHRALDPGRRLGHLPGPARVGQQRPDDVLLLRRRARGAARVRRRRAARAPPPDPAGARRPRRDGRPGRDLPRLQRRRARSAHGWGVAMSTDTAFALGMLALVGPRFPDRLRGFMLTIIVVDDVVALLVIAVAYSGDVDLGPLLIAAGVFGLAVARRSPCGSATASSTSLLAAAAWVALFESGVDPVVLGLAIGLVAGAYPAGRGELERATRPLPRLPRAADPGARALGAGRAARGGLAERAPAAALPPVDELRDRAALRPRQRRHRDRRRLPLARLHLADHARDPRRLRARQAGRDRRRLLAGDEAEPRPAAPAGRLGGDGRRRRDRRDRLHRLAADRGARLPRRRAARGEARRAQRRALRLGPDLARLPRAPRCCPGRRGSGPCSAARRR